MGDRNAAAALKVTRMELVVKMDYLEEHVIAATLLLRIHVPRAHLESFLSEGIGAFFLTHHVIQADLELVIFLHQPPECRNALPFLAKLFLKPKWSALRTCECCPLVNNHYSGFSRLRGLGRSCFVL